MASSREVLPVVCAPGNDGVYVIQGSAGTSTVRARVTGDDLSVLTVDAGETSPLDLRPMLQRVAERVTLFETL
jgi:hypothetical protein